MKYNILVDGSPYFDPFTNKLFKEDKIMAQKIAFMLRAQGPSKKIEVIES